MSVAIFPASKTVPVVSSEVKADDYIAIFPSLYSHKGTPVRLLFELSSGSPFVVEPLRYNAGGLVLKSAVSQTLLPGGETASSSFSLLSHDARVVKEMPVPTDTITAIHAFVVYPDGATWEGRIFEGHENTVGMLVWSWELGRRLKVENFVELFGLDQAWPDVPTTVGFFANDTVAGCSTREHPCPTQCHRRTKSF